MLNTLSTIAHPPETPPAHHAASVVGVSRAYAVGGAPFFALKDVTLHIARGQLTAIVGKSGCGKSTLLHLLAGIDRATAGRVVVDGVELGGLDEAALARFRGRQIGVIFQSFQLLPTLTVLENVLLPLDLAGVRPDEARARAVALLKDVGLADQAEKFPTALSGGQQQRVAVARALTNRPALIVADEPTGNLDSASAAAVLELLRQQVTRGATVVLVTHDESVARAADALVRLRDGVVVDDGAAATGGAR